MRMAKIVGCLSSWIDCIDYICAGALSLFDELKYASLKRSWLIAHWIVEKLILLDLKMLVHSCLGVTMGRIVRKSGTKKNSWSQKFLFRGKQIKAGKTFHYFRWIFQFNNFNFAHLPCTLSMLFCRVEHSTVFFSSFLLFSSLRFELIELEER